MGNMRPIDSAMVKNETYDVLSADTMGGEYIETIGAACQNPDGYTSGSLFLGKDNDVQHLYKATAAIAFGETIILDTNCVYTTVSGELEGKAEESEVSSLNEALTNEVVTRAANGAHNLLPNDLVTQVKVGVTYTVNGDKTITCSGSATTTSYVDLPVPNSLFGKTVILSGCPSGGALSKYRILVIADGVELGEDKGDGATFTIPSTTTTCFARILVYTGYGSGLTFKPMIRLDSDTDPIYQPYAKTNRELTDDVAELSDSYISTRNNVLGNVLSFINTISTTNYLNFFKKGKICHFTATITPSSDISAWAQIGTLLKYLPPQTYSAPVGCLISENVTAPSGEIFFNPDSTINIGVAMKANVPYMIDITYFVE